MANGRVCTGFSKPYVAKYTVNEETGAVSYTNGQVLARGVSCSLEIETADDNIFHADNIAAEVAPGKFQSGELTLTVDGLLMEAERLIMGLPEAGEDGLVDYDDRQAIPYMGVGVIARFLSSGVESWVPVILTKVRFAQTGLEAETQEEEMDWQTQELTASVMRDDTPRHRWKRVGSGSATEAAAEAIIKTALNIA